MMNFSASDSLSPFDVGGVNGYAYCEGDPLNRSDPSGHQSPWKQLFAWVSGGVAVVAGYMASQTEGEARTVWIGVSAVAGVLSMGLTASAVLKKGTGRNRDIMNNDRVDPALRTSPDPVGGVVNSQAPAGSGLSRYAPSRTLGGSRVFKASKPQRPASYDRERKLSTIEEETASLRSL
ncbi:MAG: hypothetical protein LBJ37_28065 [Paucimonas sp.]|nr:hypothetical protein [Paucimonas sp.]